MLLLTTILQRMLTNLYTSIMPIELSKEMKSVGLFYLMWIVLSYIAPHIYVYFCTPITIIGFFISPFIAAAPHCSALRWVIYEGGNMITTMWLGIGSYIAAKLLLRN